MGDYAGARDFCEKDLEITRRLAEQEPENTERAGALVDGLEGRKSLELISAIYESVETGKEVFLRFVPKMCRLGMIRDAEV